MKEAVFRLGVISISVLLLLLALMVLLAQVKDPAIIRAHPALNNLPNITLWNQLPVGKNFVEQNHKRVIGVHLYPAKNFWVVSSSLVDKTYFTKEDLKKHAHIKWKFLLQKYPKQKFFVYIHSQNPVDLFKFLEISEPLRDRMLVYSDFLKTAAWFRKEAPLMAIAVSPTVLLRMNFFSRLWIEGLVPVRAHFAYIPKGEISFKVLRELQRRAIRLFIDKSLVNKNKKEGKVFRKFIKNTFSIKDYSLVFDSGGS